MRNRYPANPRCRSNRKTQSVPTSALTEGIAVTATSDGLHCANPEDYFVWMETMHEKELEGFDPLDTELIWAL